MGTAIAAVNAGAYTLAIGYLNSIVLRAPDYAEGWNKRATVYWLMGADDHRSMPSRWPISTARSRSSRAIGGRSPAAAWIMQDLGKDKQAVAAFRQSLAIDPWREDVLVSLRLLEDKLGKGI